MHTSGDVCMTGCAGAAGDFSSLALLAAGGRYISTEILALKMKKKNILVIFHEFVTAHGENDIAK